MNNRPNLIRRDSKNAAKIALADRDDWINNKIVGVTQNYLQALKKTDAALLLHRRSDIDHVENAV